MWKMFQRHIKKEFSQLENQLKTLNEDKNQIDSVQTSFWDW